MSTSFSPARWVLCLTVLASTAGLLFAFRSVAPYRTNAASGTSACSDYLIPAVEDSTFNDTDWTSTFVVNEGSPQWTIDFAVQTNDSEDIDPVTAHYEDPADPPVRYVRFSRRNGTTGTDAYAMVGTLLNKTVVPLPSYSVSFIQFDYDQFGGNQRAAPLIYQNARYYQGPERLARRDSGWQTTSTGCLRASDFEDLTGPSDPTVSLSLSRPMTVGYSLAWETDQNFGLRDHMIDNLRVSLDADAMVLDTSSANRPPFAINDRTVALVEKDHAMVPLRIIRNDKDPDEDALSVVQRTDPLWGTLSPGGDDPTSNIDNIYTATNLPRINGPPYDLFDYTMPGLEDRQRRSLKIS